jgi:hypothetical protein
MIDPDRLVRVPFVVHTNSSGSQDKVSAGRVRRRSLTDTGRKFTCDLTETAEIGRPQDFVPHGQIANRNYPSQYLRFFFTRFSSHFASVTVYLLYFLNHDMIVHPF